MNKQDFLNPKSMLTPGIAGGTVMLITNALIGQFHWSGPIVALILSFLVGALVFLAGSVPLLKRAIYYVLNSLIIFAMATGSASVGNKAEEAMTNPPNTRVAVSATPAAMSEIPSVKEVVTKPPNTKAAVSPTPVAASETPKAASPTSSVTRASRVSRSASVGNKAEEPVTKSSNTRVAASSTRVTASPTPSLARASSVSRNATTNKVAVTNTEIMRPINPNEVRTSKKIFFKKW